MLKTLKNANGKVTGLLINNKKFSLSRDVCHALSFEERNVQMGSQIAINDIKAAKKELENKTYRGETDNLGIEIQFNEAKEIIAKNGNVDFGGKFETDQKTRKLFMDLLEHFVKCINTCNRNHSLDVETRVKRAIRKVA